MNRVIIIYVTDVSVNFVRKKHLLVVTRESRDRITYARVMLSGKQIIHRKIHLHAKAKGQAIRAQGGCLGTKSRLKT